MKRLAYMSLMVSGLVFLFFLVNILMYRYVPAYHDALEEAVAGDSHIPVVVVNEESSTQIDERYEYIIIDEKSGTITEDEMVPLAPEIPSDEEEECATCELQSEKQIIDKTYYEDCGTGKGYWVIKYDDGSTSVEQ